MYLQSQVSTGIQDTLTSGDESCPEGLSGHITYVDIVFFGFNCFQLWSSKHVEYFNMRHTIYYEPKKKQGLRGVSQPEPCAGHFNCAPLYFKIKGFLKSLVSKHQASSSRCFRSSGFYGWWDTLVLLYLSWFCVDTTTTHVPEMEAECLSDLLNIVIVKGGKLTGDNCFLLLFVFF